LCDWILNNMLRLRFNVFSSVLLLVSVTLLWGAEKRESSAGAISTRNVLPHRTEKIGDNPFPTNPMNDRAKGYLLQGKVKNVITNYGNFINWDEFPAGLWGRYTYLPAVAFMAGVPGQAYSSRYHWELVESIQSGGIVIRQTWESTDAYDAWFADGDTNFVGILFEANNDRGLWQPDSVARVLSTEFVTDVYQWGIDDYDGTIFMSLPGELDPNLSTSRVGLIRPWALRPALRERTDEFDVYDYGPDKEEWTADDNYMYYGANVAESWFTRWNPSTNTDWHASTKARVNTHNTEVTAGDIFGGTPYTDPDDTYPLLAHSNYSQTWPTKFDIEKNSYEPFWPGWWAEDFNIALPGCSGSRKDPDCWETVPGRFISDTDVYLEFDDRWAHRGNMVNTNNEYEQTGYPMGLRVMAEAHSYGVSYAEDIMFVTVRVRNESGDFYDENGVFHEAMIMPDGTKLNRGKGFDYKDISLGFYMDADVVSTDINGNFNVHTNADDFMEYYWERFEVGDESMLISMAMVYDYDGNSNGATELGIVATQLLDSPLATREVDLDEDGFPDIFPGEPLKMTDWHWFDWYNRPGVVTRESNTNCCAGNPGRPQAQNKEEILLKVMQGDTVNLSADEKAWFFHTPHPDTDLGSELNPHFDSLEGLEEEDAFKQGEEGLDCVLIMSCGPFDLDVGEEVPFSFCIIFGESKEDLINNARFAQIMYNSHYQGYTPPSRPNVVAIPDRNKVTLYWDNIAELSKDVVTGYADFEGYKIYKSTDGGNTWGTPDKKIYDNNGIFVGWQPLAQFDLSAYEDSIHCIYENDICDDGQNRGHAIAGPDPRAPWFSLGSNTGLEEISTFITIDGKDYYYFFEDTNVVDGMEYTYAVTAYDMGVEADYTIVWKDTTGGVVPDTIWSTANPEHWSHPDGYASIENSRGTTVLDPNFVTVIPGAPPQEDLSKIKVVPNPYKVRSRFNEDQYTKLLRFTNLPAKCKITIYTVTGEKVAVIDHESETSGNVFWDLRTINNQEVSPGLYIYVVESGGKEHIGKFAVVR
jgi:hypothetical protein